jgi:hypothetical protein
MKRVLMLAIVLCCACTARDCCEYGRDNFVFECMSGGGADDVCQANYTKLYGSCEERHP